MLNFFRKIRYKLMNKNNTFRYLKYALGEIVLVVIGILIALSINNWNEKRKIDFQADELTEKLLVEMEQTIGYLKFTNRGIDHQIQFIQMVLNANTSNLDSIVDQNKYGLSPVLYMSSYSQFFDPPSDIYKTALNDGSIRNIKDNRLLSLLQEFHQLVKVRLDELIEEEYALGREINDYLAHKFSKDFEKDFYSKDSKYDKKFLKGLFLEIKLDGTLRYKLAERIEYKKARQRFIMRFKEKFENNLSILRSD